MLVSNVSGERRAYTIVKDSGFYIEIAKFVQAYTTIVKNPNEFLTEIGEHTIDEESERLTWAQFVKIVQVCDLGFENTPSETDLLVEYNYALEIGSLDGVARKLASVDDVANAQKHYYNFVDEAAENAQAEYAKHHTIAVNREKEVDSIDSKLMMLKTGYCLSFLFMLVGVFFLSVGVSAFFFNSVFVRVFENILTYPSSQYLGAAIYIIVGFVIFAVSDKFFIKNKDEYSKLKVATDIIFKRVDETLREEEFLKHKLDRLNKDLQVVQAELADKTKKYDVKHNIEVLKSSNKYYKKLCEKEEESSYTSDEYANDAGRNTDDNAELAPVKLTKEQQENIRTVKKEAIGLEGVLDEEAYNEKFEKSEKSKEKESEKEEDKKEIEAEKEQKTEAEQNLTEQDIATTMDYLNDILGLDDYENEKE